MEATREIKSSWIEFSIAREVTREEALELQMSLAYHPAGYSFYDYKVEDGKTTWKCFRSCD